MSLFGFGKKKEPAPAPKPEPKSVEISGPPDKYMILVNGQWYINPNYDSSAPKSPKVEVFGLGDDDDDEDKEEDDDDF